jgi:hypothetical protein
LLDCSAFAYKLWKTSIILEVFLMKKEVIMKDDNKEVKVFLTEKQFDRINKIAKQEFASIESMLENIISQKIGFHDDIGLECEYCHKTIKENEKYYVQESSISKYEKLGDTISEEKLDAWSDKILCLRCNEKLLTEKYALENQTVKNFDRRTKVLEGVKNE